MSTNLRDRVRSLRPGDFDRYIVGAIQRGVLGRALRPMPASSDAQMLPGKRLGIEQAARGHWSVSSAGKGSNYDTTASSWERVDDDYFTEKVWITGERPVRLAFSFGAQTDATTYLRVTILVDGEDKTGVSDGMAVFREGTAGNVLPCTAFLIVPAGSLGPGEHEFALAYHRSGSGTARIVADSTDAVVRMEITEL